MNYSTSYAHFLAIICSGIVDICAAENSQTKLISPLIYWSTCSYVSLQNYLINVLNILLQPSLFRCADMSILGSLHVFFLVFLLLFSMFLSFLDVPRHRGNFMSSCFLHKSRFVLVKKSSKQACLVHWTPSMAWENQIELTKCFRCSNGIAGGANNRFAPLERDLLSYCDCKRHLCVNMGKVWAACYCMGYGNRHQRAKCQFCTLLPHFQYSNNISVYVAARYAVFLLFSLVFCATDSTTQSLIRGRGKGLFSQLSRSDLGPTPASIEWVPA